MDEQEKLAAIKKKNHKKKKIKENKREIKVKKELHLRDHLI